MYIYYKNKKTVYIQMLISFFSALYLVFLRPAVYHYLCATNYTLINFLWNTG